MKDINNFIFDALKINSKSKISVNKLDIGKLKLDFWDKAGVKLISKEDLIKYSLEALKNSKTFASDIQDEIGQYEDPDDLNDARDNDELTNYLKFENSLANLLADDNQYSGLEGDICDNVFDNVYDLMEELYKMTSK